ncbi:MAG: CoA transferase [Alphaproteobacteria bacterium]|nr:CoA transferase [Alphaproteobacteria bacterium]
MPEAPSPPARTPLDALAALWQAAGCPEDALDQVALEGDDPVQPSSFRVARAALAVIGAQGLAAAELWRLRSGRRQSVRVGARAAAASFRSERYLLQDGKPARDAMDSIHGFHQTRDGRWVQLHTNFPHFRAGSLRLLGLGPAATRAEVQAVLKARWDGQAVEDRWHAEGLVASLIRSPAEWNAHPHGQAMLAEPLFDIERIGDAPVEPLPPGGARPLAGVRVLDLTRVIAGPVGGRTLAEHGADVLRVTGPHLYDVPALVMDNSRGKRSAVLDLCLADDQARLVALAATGDVFLQGYRPGTLAVRGFSPEALAAARPGIVCVSLCAYGWAGPWAARRGYDSLVQCAGGIGWAETEAFGATAPRHLPNQTLDHATGYLAAFGAMVALARRATAGGSWHVRVSLARTARWLERLGRIEAMGHPDPGAADVSDLLVASDTAFGRLSHVRPAVILSDTPCFAALPATPPGAHLPEWLAR